MARLGRMFTSSRSLPQLQYVLVLCCLAIQWHTNASPVSLGFEVDENASNDTNVTTLPMTTSTTVTTVNVTNATSPTTATTRSTSNPNTIKPQPTIPTPKRIYYWNASCVSLAVANITFRYRHPDLNIDLRTDVPTLNKKYNISSPKVSGPCRVDSNTASMELIWNSTRKNATDNFTLTFKFAQSGGYWEATEILHSDSGRRPYRYADQDYFQTPLATAFECGRRVTHSIDSVAVLDFVNLKIQAFTLDNTFSKSVQSCPESTKPSPEKNLALIIGASIGSVVFIGLLAVLIGKSAHREYELLK